MPTTLFHPAVTAWFGKTFERATEPQQRAWPAIADGKHTLIAAPTGSGKTLAAFLAAIDALIRQGVAGHLTDATQVVYVSPLKALSNDIEKNLRQPLAGIREELKALNLPDVDIRVQVRTGDTTQSERAAMRKQPPQIIVTTPESLYLLLTSESGRSMLASARTVVVDEIHAIAGSKRGAHLALSLERLDALAGRHLTRVGLSATQKPIEEVARLLVGADTDEHGNPRCTIVDAGYTRERDLALELPDAPLEAVMSEDTWGQLYDRMAQLISAHHTTLVFVNTRRLAERVARHLSERLGKENVTSHHGSMAKESRLDAEQRLKAGQLRALVATASLELGIDIGDVDLVCQLGTPRAISAFLQRVGRSGHAVQGTPKGRLFPLSRDELVECTALLDAVNQGELDRLRIPAHPLDVLAQQIVAEVAARTPRDDDDENFIPSTPQGGEGRGEGENLDAATTFLAPSPSPSPPLSWGRGDLGVGVSEEKLFEQFRRAYPYRNLTRADYTAVVRMLAEGFSTRRGRRSAYLHRDAVNGVLRARAGARLTALTCGGAIPDNADYKVVLEPAGLPIGTLNEDFAVESMSGDILQLGNASYRIRKIEPGIVRVEDAQGMPPTIPFWLGEAPARTDELSNAVSRLREAFDNKVSAAITADVLRATTAWMSETYRLPAHAAEQITDYLASAKAVLGALPTLRTIILERFFDETGGMQLVLHLPFGARINRAWGLSLRKRFCRKFNFELQAAATEDAIVLSLGETHSFPLEEVARYLHSNSVRDILIQALLDAPLFTTRWRWNATISLAVKRFRGGRRHPAPLARMDAEDLIAVVFPDQIACAENLTREREIPDHPLVKQTLDDCLTEAMDVDGLIALLRGIENGEIKIIARDLPHPSPLSQEILNAKPYAFLDDAPLEERRTQAVMSRRWLDPLEAAEFGGLDADAIARVRAEAWPDAGNTDEMHDALMLLGCVTQQEAETSGWNRLLTELATARRATRVSLEHAGNYWIAAESIPMWRAVHPNSNLNPAIDAPAEYAARTWSTDTALVELLRARLQGLGPVTATQLAESLVLDVTSIDAALLALESEGFAMRGQFTPATTAVEWCERRLLARIHRYTVERLRAEIEPVATADFLRFLFDWHGITADTQPEGPQALTAVVEQLEGFEAAAAAWEGDLLPARTHRYDPDWLDTLCRSGRVVWARLALPKTASNRATTPVRSTPISLVPRKSLPLWQTIAPATYNDGVHLSVRAQAVENYLAHHGASFFEEIIHGAGLLKSETEDALRELVAVGRINADGFSGLRTLLLPTDKRRSHSRRRRGGWSDMDDAGRWSLLHREAATPHPALSPPGERGKANDVIEYVARTLLRRYGVVFRQILTREPDWLPSWYELLKIYRRLEARGEIRGGRFVAGFAGEQYALTDAVSGLRAIRKKTPDHDWVSISAADPLNLVGILTPGARVPAIASNRVLYRDGVPVAIQIGGDVNFISDVAEQDAWTARNALLRPWARRQEQEMGSA